MYRSVTTLRKGVDVLTHIVVGPRMLVDEPERDRHCNDGEGRRHYPSDLPEAV